MNNYEHAQNQLQLAHQRINFGDEYNSVTAEDAQLSALMAIAHALLAIQDVIDTNDW